MKKFKNMSPKERQKLRKRKDWFNSLPEERRREFKQNREKLSPEEKRKFLGLILNHSIHKSGYIASSDLDHNIL